MDNTYIESMRAHLAQLESELFGLTDILAERTLSQYEYRAGERILQILIEACIGIAKHWSKQIYQVAPTSAYHAFERLTEHGIKEVANTQWKQIIGMRNALVHDYLNIDHEIIEHLLKTKKYQSLFVFSRLGLNNLQ